MRRNLSWALLLAGLCLLLYPSLCQRISTIRQQRAVLSDAGLVGILEIPALELTLPIRQGTSEDTLRKGVGLLEGTEFGHHAVLCGHRGLPEARLFRDLDDLKAGDVFSVTVGENTALYQVDQILVVTPEDTAALLPEEGLALCTLLTCTPYGINSHRLLVRGQRVSKMP